VDLRFYALVLIVILPLFGILIYLIARPRIAVA
jgi:hypothetical protein